VILYLSRCLGDVELYMADKKSKLISNDEMWERVRMLKRQWLKSLAVAGVTAMTAMIWNSPVNAADGDVITFATAPTQSPAKTKEIYGPLVNYMAKTTGKNIQLVIPRNFLEYTSKMRKAEYDIIFDGPHFVNWRMENIDHQPIARLPGKLVFAAIVKDGGVVNNIKQLVGKKVCAVNSPNLATLMILDSFPNPVRQPVIVSARSFKAAFECLKSGKGEAAFLPVGFWKKFKKKGKTKGLRILYTTKKKPLPTRTFSISKRLDAVSRSSIQKALLNTEGQEGAKPLLKRFRRKNFVDAPSPEFNGLSRLLLSVWGFHQ